jgi:hypothetical protein
MMMGMMPMGMGMMGTGVRGPRMMGACLAAGEYWRLGRGDAVVIEDESVGQRVRALTEAEWKYIPHEPAKSVDPAKTRRLHLWLKKGDVDYVEMVLLRHVEWLKTRDAKVGLWVYVDLPEQGAQGYAEVLAIDPCPEIDRGPGRTITGWFKHNRAQVWDLQLRAARRLTPRRSPRAAPSAWPASSSRAGADGTARPNSSRARSPAK